MIEQDLYLELLELFDLIEKEAVFLEYKQVELRLQDDAQVKVLINEYNEINDSLGSIEYEPYVQEVLRKLIKIKEKLNENSEYTHYQEVYQKCNERLIFLAGLVFEDIINVSEVECCAGK